ncbi:hypothetical protein EHM69_10760 [candidate division KSB1 bacterium]|nr:MAG: hypothetical protein EHM69_10760 [candidate division KSB1 bacterium]
MTKQEAAAALRQYAVLLELIGEDAFRARAFDYAARTLEMQGESLEELLAENRLAAIKGIGKGVTAAIVEFAERGTFGDLDNALEKVPSGVLELLRVEGLGPKRARTLWQDARITSLAYLENALDTGVVEKLPGFGAKTAEKFRAGLAYLKTVSGRHWRHHAQRAADALSESLTQIHGIDEVFFGGSLRRGMETVGDLDVLVMAPENRIESVRTAVLTLPGVTWEETGTILRGKNIAEFPIELSIISKHEAAARKVLVTGSKEHLSALKQICATRKLALENIEAETEEQVYAVLGLTYVPPALRENGSTIAPAGSREFPAPVAWEDIRGILHCHSTYSDGHNSIAELARAMIERGYHYLGIADHSQTAAYAHGLTPDRVRAQWREIDELNKQLAPFRILKGTEADILPDGSVDFDDEILAGFDFVVASIHSGFNMTEVQATERLCRALENPHVDILGHPTGRLLLERNGYPVNHEHLIACAAQNGKGIELNCSPHRLDLDWRWLSVCEEMHVPVPLCPDAHHIDGLWDIRWGIDTAAKGPLTAGNCPSTWGVETFLDWCRNHGR